MVVVVVVVVSDDDDGGVQWHIIAGIECPAEQFRIGGGSPAGDGSEEEEEDDIEPRVGEEVADAEAETPGRSDGPGGSAEEGERPDLVLHERLHAAVPERRGGEFHPQGAGGRVDSPAGIAE